MAAADVAGDDGAASDATLVGIISDTHGLLRREAVAALEGCQLIVHAGDVGDPDILDELAAIAPVHAVRGNVDHGSWAARLPGDEVVRVGAALIYVIHDIAHIDLEPAAAGFHAVVYGHSHEPEIRQTDGLLYLNPGSAGPRRFALPVSLARLRVGADGSAPRLEAELVELA